MNIRAKVDHLVGEVHAIVPNYYVMVDQLKLELTGVHAV